MSKIVPGNEAMVRDLKPQPKMPSNGCFLGCCGKASGPVDVRKIVEDGGKFLQTSDGRIVEYFVYGADAAERFGSASIAGLRVSTRSRLHPNTACHHRCSQSGLGCVAL